MTNFMAGLDFYKLTMSQQAWKVAPDAQVTFTLKNRGAARLADRIPVEVLQRHFDKLSFIAFEESDLRWMGRQGFSADYLKWLLRARFELPEPVVSMKDGDLHVEVTGAWPLVTLWETVVLSAINDLYFAGDEDRSRHLTIGHMRLSMAIAKLRELPDTKISDFGTRRRYGFRWQDQVVSRLAQELPEQFAGTSNPYFAEKYSLKPIGTFAHEMPMVYAALGDNLEESHGRMLDSWFETYGEEYSIALTDTFGSEFFFATFGEERANKWRGLRHDSGDPYAFARRAIEFYKSHGIDPLTKTIVFSDGLDLSSIAALSNFRHQIGVAFGWGTGLTNNVGVDPLNIVMKATSVNGVGTVKLSDDEGKHTGSPENVARYQSMVSETLKGVTA